MNQPAPRELCEKLQEMGCVSESGLLWSVSKNMKTGEIIEAIVLAESHFPFSFRMRYFDEVLEHIEDCPLFVQNDFTGATERARKNASLFCKATKWMPGSGRYLHECSYSTDALDITDQLRHRLIDLHSQTWFNFLESLVQK